MRLKFQKFCGRHDEPGWFLIPSICILGGRDVFLNIANVYVKVGVTVGVEFLAWYAGFSVGWSRPKINLVELIKNCYSIKNLREQNELDNRRSLEKVESAGADVGRGVDAKSDNPVLERGDAAVQGGGETGSDPICVLCGNPITDRSQAWNNDNLRPNGYSWMHKFACPSGRPVGNLTALGAGHEESGPNMDRVPGETT